jgi:serine/threonine protein kinase
VPAKLDHPAVVRIFQTGKCEAVAFYVMQLVNGISLSRLIARANEPTAVTQSFSDDARPTPQEAPASDATQDDASAPAEPPVVRAYLADRYRTLARLGVQAARALAWTHKKGFLHRDIKPSNIMVDHHDQLYLVDFGLTRALDSSATTRIGTLLGTPYYMSPEQAIGQPLDSRSDIFSLGVSLYQLATAGRGPYKASRDDSDAVLRQVRAGELLPLNALVDSVPPMLQAIIQRAVDPDPARRYQKAEELADELERFLQQTPGDAASALPAPVSPGLGRWLTAAVVLLLVTLSAAVIYLFATAPWREPREPIAQRPPADDKKPEAKPTGGDGKTPIPPKDVKPPGPPTLREFFQRDRPLNTKVPLLRADNQPARSKQLLSPASYFAMSKEIVLTSNKESKPALLALDDPGPQNFEFSIEMKHWDRNVEGRHDAGIFFGWRENLVDPLERPRFFAVRIDPVPDNLTPHGRLTIGSWLFEEPKDARGGLSEQNIRVLFGPKEGPKGIVPLPAPKDKRVPYYRVYVRVVNKEIAVGVEDEPPVEFSVAWMMNNDKWLRTFTLDPYGAFGIWTRNGQACFRNATIMALPKDQ